MGKKRPDGVYIDNINPYTKIMPHIMPHRYDAMNWCKVEVSCDGIDRFIAEQHKLGKRYSYYNVVMAALVRTFAMRPSLNRFVMNRKIYQHNDITASFAVKKILKDNSEDTTVKVHFKGDETIDEVSKQMEEVIAANTGVKAYNSVDDTAKMLTNAPHFMIKLVVKLLNWLDHHNMLPASLIETSPFHNSFFITFMKSIHGDYLYHHCYDFGTTSMFIGMGREKETPVVENGEVKVGKVLTLGVVCDERFCDGLYYVNSMRLIKKLLMNPEQLLEPIDLAQYSSVNGIAKEGDKKRKLKKNKKDNKNKKDAKNVAIDAETETQAAATTVIKDEE